jgi:hypothetical protein
MTWSWAEAKLSPWLSSWADWFRRLDTHIHRYALKICMMSFVRPSFGMLIAVKFLSTTFSILFIKSWWAESAELFRSKKRWRKLSAGEVAKMTTPLHMHVDVVKQLDSVESTEWIGWTNLSQWMYFDCGALLLYQIEHNQTDATTYSMSETV